MTDIPLRRADPGVHSSPDATAERRELVLLRQSAQEWQYRGMAAAFRATGGIAGSEELAALLQGHTHDPIALLARWIVAQEVLEFEWSSRTVLPLFQFDRATMAPRPTVSAVTRELLAAMNGWDGSLWFARPNAWLDDASPVDVITLEPGAVLRAARAERYRVRG